MQKNRDTTELVLSALADNGQASNMYDDGPLQRLIYKARSEPDLKRAIQSIIDDNIIELLSGAEIPEAILDLVISSGLSLERASRNIEDAVTSGSIEDTAQRLVALRLLRSADRALLPKYVLDDTKIRALAPGPWVDLALPLLSTSKEKRELLLKMVESSELNLNALMPRLEEIWSAGGYEQGTAFLNELCTALVKEEREVFSDIAQQVFNIKISQQEDKSASRNRISRISQKFKKRFPYTRLPTLRRDKETVLKHAEKAGGAARQPIFTDFHVSENERAA